MVSGQDFKATLLPPEFERAMVEAGAALDAGDDTRAVRSFVTVLRHYPDLPDAHFGLAQALLRLGRWREAWEHYEWRRYRKSCALVQYPLPWWDGSSLAGSGGKLLIQGEQGLGDTLQFSRYARWAQARAAVPVVLVVQPQLRRLFEPLAGDYELRTDGEAVTGVVAWSPLLSLPRLHGSTPDFVPEPECFGRLPLSSSAPLPHSNPLRIGLAWRSNKRNSGSASVKSTELETLLPLARVPHTRWVSLQQEMTPQEVKLFQREFRGEVDAARLFDFANTAAWMDELDLVITIDTSVAHLAGCIARESWVLLAANADWRYLRKRSDSPWYPRMRLFRCPSPQAWAVPVEQMRSELSRRTLSAVNK